MGHPRPRAPVERLALGAALLVAGCTEQARGTVSFREGADHGAHRRVVFALHDAGDVDGLAHAPAFPARLGALRERAAQRSGYLQPHLDRVRSAAIPRHWSDDDARDWVQRMDGELAWVVLRLAPTPSPADLPPTTPSYVRDQGYRSSATGIGADEAQAAGWRGAGVTVHDVEYGWRTEHEDLVDADVVAEAGQTVSAEALQAGLAPEHGTATVGMLVAPHNDYGIDGLLPDARVATYPEWTEEGGLRRTEAVASAVSAAQPGDVVMLQMQAQHPDTGQLGPAELEPDVWMLTRMATDAGILVVAAAGNGGLNLDTDEAYGALGDSGAILVGAGDPDDRTPLAFSSHGRRVDLQGWGRDVFTLGYGDHARLADDDAQAYTSTFEGTSAALPMVVAASAFVLEAFTAAEGAPPSPDEVRRLLVATGHAQGEGPHVGPRPSVDALAWANRREDEPPLVELSPEQSEVFVDFGASYSLELGVTVADDSPIYRTELELDGSGATLADGSANTFTVTLQEGMHTLRARATDVWGNAAWSDPVAVEVLVEDKPAGTSTGGEDGDSGGTSDSASSGAATSPEGGGCVVGTRRRPTGWIPYTLVLAFIRPRRRAR